MRKKTFAQQFYDDISTSEENLLGKDIMISKDRFLTILEEEICNYTKDSMAEVGMGIHRLIEHHKKRDASSEIILQMVINVCRGLISNSPESALEFSTLIEKRHGI